ncbi:MAG: helix-turn-helix domain-containing protein [Pseudomonadales bacterium]|nr:helix-turn-helix domain-containing protein [Pseudomonadales bacterium]
MKVDNHKIKELRFSKSWSQEQLAQEAKVSLRTIQRMELDGSASLKSRLAVAEALGVKPSDLDVVEETVYEEDASTESSGANGNKPFLELLAYPGPIGLPEKIRKFLMVCLWFLMVSTGGIVVLTSFGFFVYYLTDPNVRFEQILLAQIPPAVIFLITATIYFAFRRYDTITK